MTIKKLGHCCLIIEIDGVRILTDPGMLSMTQNEARDIHLILITHEHADHLHIESVKKLLENNPGAPIITNSSVGKILAGEGIAFQKIEHGESITKGVVIEGFGNEHAEIYKEFSRVQNTGYFIGNTFFYPGDAFFVPPKTPEILALPVAGPWMKIKEAIDYAKEVKPNVCFPVHDGIIHFIMPFHKIPELMLKEAGIEFIPMLMGDEKEF
ncbi:MAG: MBL fold metallo-hydrolase [Patescibacteria group bacterium]